MDNDKFILTNFFVLNFENRFKSSPCDTMRVWTTLSASLPPPSSAFLLKRMPRLNAFWFQGIFSWPEAMLSASTTPASPSALAVLQQG